MTDKEKEKIKGEKRQQLFNIGESIHEAIIDGICSLSEVKKTIDKEIQNLENLKKRLNK